MNRNMIIVAMTEIATRGAKLGDELVEDHEKIVELLTRNVDKKEDEK